MQQYLDLVESVLAEGEHKPNRTGVDTLSSFSQHYTIDLSEGFPLLTTKDMSGYRWNSLIHELLWYFSGEEHVRNLREETKIWDAWADDEGRLDTAYGRFWRRYPIPEDGLDGETWPDDTHRWVNEDEQTFDQIQYAIDQLRENPNSRRIVINAWHPANAAVSTLPPCHYSFVLNVQNGRLNLNLMQRSGDIALGIPFNIAAYSIIAMLLAREADLELGEFGHTIVDAHIYCGKGARGDWYGENLTELQERLHLATTNEDFREIREWVLENAPADEDADDPAAHEYGYDHVPGLLEQLARTPGERPRLEIADKPLDELTADDFELTNYESDDGLGFSVAE